MLEGPLVPLQVEPASPARYRLTVRPTADAAAAPDPGIELNPLLGRGLRIDFHQRITCSECGTETPRSYAEGYCYRCFKRLARCDLCVVNPVRCHYAAGTCREPAWGEAHCMRPHLVYLANSSGPKVGITGAGGELRRWLDQGASQGLVVAEAPTRHLAGVLEDHLGRRVSDRTDWRALVSADAAGVDLPALRRQLEPLAAELPDGVRWLDDRQPVTLEYPVRSYPRRLVRFDLERSATVAGRLVGIKGQYLLFEHGVLNVRRHRAFHARITCLGDDDPALAEPLPGQSQMELFT